MRDVAVVGVGMTRFGKFPEKSLKDLVRGAVEPALSDAGLDKSRIEAAYMGNSVAGLMTGQEAIRGQVVLSGMGIDSIPIFNLESACASSSMAFNLGYTAVAAGVHDCVLVCGYEKMFDQDKSRTFAALSSAIDVEDGLEYFKEAEKHSPFGDKIVHEGAGQSRSIFMDYYSFIIKGYMREYGFTQEDFARLSVKSHKNGALNPHAQYQKEVTLEEVLNSGDIVHPLTLMMCSPIGDGAAAAILCSKSVADRLTTKPIWVAGSVVGSGKVSFDPGDSVSRRLSAKIWESTGVGPGEVDVVEVHDATSPSEIMFLVDLGLVPGEEAVQWINNGNLELDGRMPSNPSGGLASKGHPVGATGCGMVYEIVTQLRGQAGKRQIARPPKIGMTLNGGGILGLDAASLALHMFKK